MIDRLLMVVAAVGLVAAVLVIMFALALLGAWIVDRSTW